MLADNAREDHFDGVVNRRTYDNSEAFDLKIDAWENENSEAFDHLNFTSLLV